MSSHDEDNSGGENSSMNLHDDESVRYSDEEESFLEGHVARLFNEEARVEDGEESGFQGGVKVDQQGWGSASWGGNWKEQPIAKLNAQQFCEKLDLFNSPKVTIVIGPERATFNIAKGLLCHSSKFFDRALNGSFKEAVEQKISLEEDTVEAFQMLVQYIFTGNAVLSYGLDLSEQVGTILDFLKLADKIGLLGSLTSVTDNLRDILSNSRCRLPTRASCQQNSPWGQPWSPCRGHTNNGPGGWYGPLRYCTDNNSKTDFDPLRDNVLKSQHLHAAFELPPGHDARTIIVEACVTSYLLSSPDEWRPPPPFKFQQELDTIEGFSSELLQAVRKSVKIRALHDGNNALVTDPLTGNDVSI